MKYFLLLVWILFFLIISSDWLIGTPDDYIQLLFYNAIMLCLGLMIYYVYFKKGAYGKNQSDRIFIVMVGLISSNVSFDASNYERLAETIDKCRGYRHCPAWLNDFLGPDYYLVIPVVFFIFAVFCFYFLALNQDSRRSDES